MYTHSTFIERDMSNIFHNSADLMINITIKPPFSVTYLQHHLIGEITFDFRVYMKYFRCTINKDITLIIDVGKQTMKIALCQMNSKADKAANIESALALLDEAGKQNADVAILPECVDYVGPDEGVYENSEELGGPLSTALSAKAKELGIWVVGGTHRVREGNDTLVGNTMIVFNPEGEPTASYKKLHMFDITIPGEVDFLESRTVKKGQELVTTEIDGVLSGLSICYDLRFPELFRLYALQGAKIIFLSAAFTAYTGAAHWETLLKARAIENGCFVVACGQTGEHMPNFSTFGNSLVISPWGTVLANGGDEVGVVTVDIDLDDYDKNKKIMPSLNNRRTDIYTLSAAKEV